MDAAIRPAQELLDAANELRRLLAPVKFPEHVAAEKQTALLAVASDILMRMTSDLFGFAANFTIVDQQWASERHPATLSGGESFLASLALALALV